MGCTPSTTRALPDLDLQTSGTRMLSNLFALGGGLGIVSGLLPGRERPGLAILMAVLGLVVAGVLRWRTPQLSRPVQHLVVILGSMIVTTFVYCSGHAVSGEVLLYSWVGLFAGFYLGGRALALHVAVVAVVYAVPVLILNPVTAGAQTLVVVTGGAAAVGWWSLRARRIVETLLARHAALARTDALTGLANRSELVRVTSNWLAVPDDQSVTVLVIDLDGFKRINDEWGHAAGDAVLRATADRLRAGTRPQDLVARLGGDEFALLLTGIGEREAEDFARRVEVAVRRPVRHAGHDIAVGVSVGATTCRARSVEAAIRVADEAMYAAKRAGGGWRGARLEADRDGRGAHPDGPRSGELRRRGSPALG